MKSGRAVSGSFRDPSGRVYELDGRILRTVAERFTVDFDFVDSTGLLQKLITSWLVPFEKTDTDGFSTLFAIKLPGKSGGYDASPWPWNSFLQSLPSKRV